MAVPACEKKMVARPYFNIPAAAGGTYHSYTGFSAGSFYLCNFLTYILNKYYG